MQNPPLNPDQRQRPQYNQSEEKEAIPLHPLHPLQRFIVEQALDSKPQFFHSLLPFLPYKFHLRKMISHIPQDTIQLNSQY
jgi:hypothetical protein